MASNTTRLGLRKPSGSDLINVQTDLNANYDILDNAAVASLLNTFTGQVGTTHESNRVDGAAQIYGRGVAIAGDGQTHKSGITLGLSVSVARGTPAAVFANTVAAPLELWGSNSGNGQRKLTMQPNGNMLWTGSEHYFGFYSEGVGPGSTLHVSAASDGNVYLIAESSFSGANLKLRAKPPGVVEIQDETASALAQFYNRAAINPMYTAMFLFWKDEGGTARFDNVRPGPANSGTAGYRLLAVPN